MYSALLCICLVCIVPTRTVADGMVEVRLIRRAETSNNTSIDILNDNIAVVSETTTYVANDSYILQTSIPDDVEIVPVPNTCPSYICSDQPMNITQLKPCHVKLVLAVGDSVSAAAVARSLFHWIREWRGLAWSIGGDLGYTTLPNYLRNYNPELVGYSLGFHKIEYLHTPHLPSYDFLNGAQSGALAESVIPEQLSYIKSEMKSLNVTADMWKVLTVFIGANNLCRSCEGLENDTAEGYQAQLNATMETIYTTFPNTYVNLVSLFNLSSIYYTQMHRVRCILAHDMVSECNCLYSPGINGNANRTLMDKYATAYNSAMREVTDWWNARELPDFAISYHPYFEEFSVESSLFLSPVDCFHPSVLGHSALATTLWNSMLTPAAQRPRNVSTLFPTPLCPTEDAVFLF